MASFEVSGCLDVPATDSREVSATVIRSLDAESKRSRLWVISGKPKLVLWSVLSLRNIVTNPCSSP